MPLVVDPAATALLTDFDGTLAPIVDVPADARPLDGVPAVLGRLARRFASVTVVSGRPVGFLWAHLGVQAADASAPVRLVGLYGMESAGPDGAPVLDPAAAAWQETVRTVADRLRVGAPDGVRVEVTGPAVTVHYRQAPDAAAWVAGRTTTEAAASGLVAHAGRLAVELRPALDLDKGVVVRRAAQGCRAVAFFGDDIGDLPGFAALAELSADGADAVGVAVVDEETAPEVAARADLTVDGPAGALAVLTWLADAADADDAADEVDAADGGRRS